MGDEAENWNECILCKKEFKSNRTLKTHLRKFHAANELLNREVYQCKICDKNYKYHASLLTHNYLHKTTVKFVCKEVGCEKVFKNTKRLSEHRQRNHNVIASFMCEYCGYITAIRGNLMVHLRLHTEERPFSCKFCKKRFNTSSGLIQHSAAHIEKRAYKCTHCGLSFFNRHVLQHHEAVHSKHKQFKCNFCNRLFTQAAGRSQHMRWHRNQLKRVTNPVSI